VAPPSTDGYYPQTIELHVFAPARDGSCASALAEDDGLTFAANNGARLHTSFTLTRRGRLVTLAAEVDGDGYPEHAREAFELVLHGADPDTVIQDGSRVTPHDGRYRIRDSGAGFSVEFEV
jgi:alpha-glucosidase